MYITKEELDKRINKPTIKVVEKIRKERGSISSGNPEKRLDDNDRTIIGILSELDTQKNIAELVGVSQTTVSNNSRGLVGVATGVNKDLRDGVNKGIEKIKDERLESDRQIKDQLLTNLAAALGHVANNLDNTDAPEASKIAVDMSKILERVNGDKEGKGNRTAIIINVPQMKEEKHYQSITV